MSSPQRHGRPLVGSAVLLTLLLTACGGNVIRVVSPFAPPATEGLSGEERALVERAGAAARAAGCRDVQAVPLYSPAQLDGAHIGGSDVPVPPPLSSYSSQPPASGPHNPAPLPSGVYPDPPPVDQTIHSLEHAAAIVWFSPAVADDAEQAAELLELADFFGPDHGDHVIVAPYHYPDQGNAGALPAGVGMALVAWHRLRLCKRISLPVAFTFVLDFRFDPAAPDRYRGEAPEPGVPIG